MRKEWYNISDMTEFLYNAVKGIEENTFMSRPKYSERMDKFAVVSFPSTIRDNGGYGSTTARIMIYVRDKSYGEDITTLGEMQKKIYGIFPKTVPTIDLSQEDSQYIKPTVEFGYSYTDYMAGSGDPIGGSSK